MKTELQKRQNLIEAYKLVAKDTKREALSDMIFETKRRAKEYETSTVTKMNDLKQLNVNISKGEDEVKYLVKEIEGKIGEGEDKKKKDDKSYDKLRESFDKLGKTFYSTKHYMDKFVDLKIKNKQLQDRILDLRRNKYQEISEKLRKDLNEITGQ